MIIIRKKHGFTILELLIAAILTTIVATAALSFFLRANQQCIAQDGIAEMQQNVRASVQDIIRELRMAGFNLTDTTIVPIAIDSLSGLTDTLCVNRDTFTVKYYIDHSDSLHPTLIKDVNGQANIFADEISDFNISYIGNNSVRVSLTAKSARDDDDIMGGERFERTISQVVNLRNL